jgi:perosamine synthetase
MEYGGDGIYAAWALTYEETLFTSRRYKERAPYYYENVDYPQGLCPVAEEVQPKLMQFVINYGSVEEAAPKVDALSKTIKFFGK